jgi:hypothetical protein
MKEVLEADLRRAMGQRNVIGMVHARQHDFIDPDRTKRR